MSDGKTDHHCVKHGVFCIVGMVLLITIITDVLKKLSDTKREERLKRVYLFSKKNHGKVSQYIVMKSIVLKYLSFLPDLL